MVLLDTNIVINHLEKAILTEHTQSVQFIVSVITVAELLRLPGLGEFETTEIERFLKTTVLKKVDAKIARTAARIGRTRKTKLPDLLIAATALVLGIPLITENLRDFQAIPKLVVRKRP